MARADLLFYPSTGTWYEKLIVAATRGPFVHVAIDLGDNTCIAAESQGIVVDRIHAGDLKRIERVNLSERSTPQHLEEAIAWANKQVGSKYGWVDIFDQGLRLLRLPFYVGQLHSLDCSDLAACYATLATDDQVLRGLVLDHRQEISPNDLARYYGLIK